MYHTVVVFVVRIGGVGVCLFVGGVGFCWLVVVVVLWWEVGVFSWCRLCWFRRPVGRQTAQVSTGMKIEESVSRRNGNYQSSLTDR